MLLILRKLKTSGAWRTSLVLLFIMFCVANHGFAQEDHWRTLNTRVKNLFSRQKYAEALPIAEASLLDAERDFGPTDTRVAVSLQNLAYLHVLQNDFPAGERMAQRALTIVETAPSPNPRLVGEALNTLSQIYEQVQRFAEAESYGLKALEIQQKALAPDDPDLGVTLGNLATLYFRQFKYPKYGEAEQYYKRSIAILEEADGSSSAQLAVVLGDFARFYFGSSRYADAMPLLVREIALKEVFLGPDHDDVLLEREILASSQTFSEQYADAERTRQRVLVTELTNTGPDRVFRVTSSYDALSRVQHLQGEDAQAEQSALQAVQVVEKELSPQDPQIETPLEDLANLYQDEKKYSAAEQADLRLLAIVEKIKPSDIHGVMILEELVKLAEEQGHLAESEPYHLRIIEFWDKSTQPDAAIRARESYAALLHKSNREREAAALDAQIQETHLKAQFAQMKDSDIAAMKWQLILVEFSALQQGFGAEYAKVADSLTQYAALLRFKGRTVEANAIEARAQSMRDHTDYAGPESFSQWFLEFLEADLRARPNASSSAQTIEELNRVAGMLRKVNRTSDAAKLQERAAQIRAKTSSP